MRARATEVAVGCALTRVSTGDRDHVHEKVPQFLLEEAGAAGLPARIIVTQPRRISAITVSERVAAERGEAVGKGTVGYQILPGQSDYSTRKDLPYLCCACSFHLIHLHSTNRQRKPTSLALK